MAFDGRESRTWHRSGRSEEQDSAVMEAKGSVIKRVLSEASLWKMREG